MHKINDNPAAMILNQTFAASESPMIVLVVLRRSNLFIENRGKSFRAPEVRHVESDYVAPLELQKTVSP